MTDVFMTGDINLLNVVDPKLPLAKVAHTLAGGAAVFSNLECMLARPRQAQSIENEGFFADPTVGIETLKSGHISAVGVANNVNYGSAGILESMSVLDENGIPHSGAGVDRVAARQPVIIESRGRRYGFLQRTSVFWPTNHAADTTAPGVAVLPGHTAYEAPMYRFHAGMFPANRPGIPPHVVTWADAEYLSAFTDDIKVLRSQVDVLIASCHWGLGHEVLTYMEQIAHAAIDAGADAVMGHGPHEPLPIGFHRGKPIFFGLGGFSFHTGHLGMGLGDWIGLLASIDTGLGSSDVTLRFVRHNDANETILCSAAEEQRVFGFLRSRSTSHGAELRIEGDVVRAVPL
jgi:poly-gamma-glutamate synthesis protein (capsule biosynthesis protein)